MQRRDMSKQADPRPDPAPLDLPPVDPVDLERALRLEMETGRPADGWKRGNKEQNSGPPKPGNG